MATFDKICELIGPYNKRKMTLVRDTSFSADLELDSLSVMDLLATIEDEFDVTVPLNRLPDLETIGLVADAVDEIMEEE